MPVAGGLGATFIHGDAVAGECDDGATYDPYAGSWTSVPSPGEIIMPNAKRENGFVWWGGGRLWTWGGATGGTSIKWWGNGASFDPAGGTWTSMASGGPSPRELGSVVWTGTEAILWGGENGASYYNDGKMFRP